MSTKPACLRIEAAGLCCAVGYRLAAAECALRAGMDHFQESEFLTSTGAPVRVARLPDATLWGAQRIGQWIKQAVDDCLQGLDDFVATDVPMIVLSPEAGRPMVDDDYRRDSFRFAEAAIGMHFEDRSAILPGGKAALAQALKLAVTWLGGSEVERVLLVGADSFLDAASINHYLDHGRLLVEGNRDGFLPGEAAAALIVRLDDGLPGTYIDGVAIASEEGRPDGSVPSRAQGLSTAIRLACEQAEVHPHDLQFRFSDQNGEGFFARDAANALTRVMFGGGPQLPVLTLADSIGETGVAAGLAMLAYLSRLMPHPDSPGDLGLVHLSNDGGLRGAIILRQQAAEI